MGQRLGLLVGSWLWLWLGWLWLGLRQGLRLGLLGLKERWLVMRRSRPLRIGGQTGW